MGDFAPLRGRRRTVAVLLVAAVAVAAVAVAVLRPSEQERFEAWLRAQPGVAGVHLIDRGLASAPVGARAFEPTLRADLTSPVDVATVHRLTDGIEAYAVRHRAVLGSTVELHHGADVALASTDHRANALMLQALRAVRLLPDLVSVSLRVQSGDATFTATVRTGTDVVAAATALATALPDDRPTWVTGSPSVAARDAVGHEVRVEPGGEVTRAAGRAFALAVGDDPMHPVVLLARPGGERAASVIRLAVSPRAAATAAALHRAGFGLGRLGQVVEGPSGPFPMDERAWAASAQRQLEQLTGVLGAVVDPGDRQQDRPVTADLHVLPQVSLAGVLRALPPAVERVEVHTAAAAPDYSRDDALAPDPEVECPAAADGALNLAYSGSPAQLTKATSYLALLLAHAPDVSCVHWAEPAEHRRPTTQTLLVRAPLRRAAWAPVLDVVRARRADLGSAHPTLVLLVPVPGTPTTATFDLREGAAPTLGTLGTDTQAQERAAEASLEPLVRYWNGSGR